MIHQPTSKIPFPKKIPYFFRYIPYYFSKKEFLSKFLYHLMIFSVFHIFNRFLVGFFFFSCNTHPHLCCITKSATIMIRSTATPVTEIAMLSVFPGFSGYTLSSTSTIVKSVCSWNFSAELPAAAASNWKYRELTFVEFLDSIVITNRQYFWLKKKKTSYNVLNDTQ